MHVFRLTALAVATASLSSAALAEDPAVQALQLGQEYVRYEKGVPTVDLQQGGGVVQVRPLPMDHGSFVFAVTVFNAGRAPANMDIANVAVTNGEDTIGLLGVDRLIKKAKGRAFWSQFGVALLGGLASGAAASQRDTYYSSLYTPHATYRSYYSAPSLAGQFQAARIEDQTAYAIGAMQSQLDATEAELSDNVMQLSTVDPGHTYSGKIVLERFKIGKLPQQLSIVVEWNGEQYPFAFQLAKPGTPAPSYTQIGRAEPPPRSYASAAAQGAGASPPDAEMVKIVRKAAEVMPAGFALPSGTKLSAYSATGTELVFVADADPSIYEDPGEWEPAARSELCTARPFAAILYQGGSIRATYRGKGRKELGTVEVSAQSCA